MAKVLLVIHSLRTGGAERVTLQFARWLLEAGHRVVLLTPSRAGADFYPLPAGLERCEEPLLPAPLERHRALARQLAEGARTQGDSRSR